jgi:hypothetical protein
MKFECHRCKKEIEKIEELHYMMDEKGFTYSYCKECIKEMEKEKEKENSSK